MKENPTDAFELEAKNLGYKNIIGVDEVGRGPLCGPVVVAGVLIPNGFDTSDIRDSKQLSAKKRSELYEKIRSSCFTSVSQIDAKLIDEVNIREATKMAMRDVINGMYLSVDADFALVDGDFVPSALSIPARAIIGGDRKSISIAAASIVAKVCRDRELEIMHVFYPVYNWKKNKGYGTKEHLDAIKVYGITKYHRKTFGGVREHVPVAKN
jgi:ribonuclease HII